MHVQCLTITPASADRRSHNDQLVFCDKVPNASLFARRLVAGVGLDVEFEGCNKGQEEGEKKLECKEHIGGRRQVAVTFCFAKVVLAVCDRKLTMFRTRCCWWSEGVAALSEVVPRYVGLIRRLDMVLGSNITN